MKIKYLEWDSCFFNKKIGWLDWSSDCDLFEIQRDYDLIYVVSDTDIAIGIGNYKQSYSENKVVFSKKLVLDKEVATENIFLGTENSTRKEIYELAFESGKYSRFNLDPNFHHAEFEKFYKKWVDNSFNKEFAAAVVVYVEQNKMVGFVTYKVGDAYASIGLIGVSPEYQGKGIGKKLIQYVENELANKGVNELRIPTQLQNYIACEFYRKLGYEIIESKSIKHFWRK